MSSIQIGENVSVIQSERLVKLFLDLCAINSPSLREDELAKWLFEHLRSIGLNVWQDDAGSKLGGTANNIIAHLPANRTGVPKIFLSAHMDTVESTDGLVIEERDGTFYSASDTILGADDLGGLAPAMEAVHSLLESDDAHGDVYLLISVAEEIGLLGAGVMPIEELGLDFGYVLDTGPPVGSYVNRTANHDKLTITIYGKPAHAGKDPELGINAIQVAAQAINGMTLGRIGPETTANLGLIQGGSGVNIVCPKVVIHAEARSTSLVDLDGQTAHMIQRFEEAASAWGATVEIEHRRAYTSYEVATHEPVAQLAELASRSLGFTPQSGTSPARTTLGGSDANIYNARGLPCIVLGTGMKAIHTHDEHISRQDLVDTARLVREIIVSAVNFRG